MKAKLALPYLIFLLFGLLWLAPANSQAQINVENVKYQLDNDVIYIDYDLIAPNKNYKVELLLKRKNDPKFTIEPTLISGDIGKGRFVGYGRRIIWNYKSETKLNFTPDPFIKDYYFEVKVD